jgi:hypothetical protein
MDVVMNVLSVLGFLLLVVAYLLNQRRVWQPESIAYLGANFVGAGLLAAYSLWIREWVFVGLEGFWSAVSLLALVRSRGRRIAAR